MAGHDRDEFEGFSPRPRFSSDEGEAFPRGRVPPGDVHAYISTLRHSESEVKMVTTRAQAKFLEGFFLKFPKLPAELRNQIWNEAVPRHGIYPVKFMAEMDLESRYPKFTIHLEPSVPHERDPGFAERINITRSLLMVCRESHAEVKRRFPDVIRHRYGKMRFNAEKDLLFIPWNLGQFHSLHYKTPDFSPAIVTFADAWNTVVRKLAIEHFMTCVSFGALSKTMSPRKHYVRGRPISQFMAFLSRFASLEQLVLVTPGLVTSSGWDKMDVSIQREVRDGFEKVYSSGMMKGPANGSFQKPVQTRLRSPTMKGAQCLKAVIHADPEAIENAYSQIHQHGMPFPNTPTIKFGYPELSHLDVVGMVHLDSELRARGICREMEFE